MREFISETRPARPNTFLYALGIFLIAAAALFFYGRSHRRNPAEGIGSIAVEGMQRPGSPNFEYYKPKIRLSSVRAGIGLNYAQHRVAIVSGTIVNEGDRKLEALELHIALFDVYGKLSKERTATPLRPGIGIKRPMEPLEKRDFVVWIEAIEQLWNPKRLEIEISGLKYQ